jgi:hypothetical protein
MDCLGFVLRQAQDEREYKVQDEWKKATETDSSFDRLRMNGRKR